MAHFEQGLKLKGWKLLIPTTLAFLDIIFTNKY